MKFTSLLGLLGLASATDVILPLYIWPGPGSPTNWGPVFSALAAYPNVTFTIVVNPDSGPGGDQYPNSDYVPAVAKLNSYKNTRVIGYVHTSYGSDDINIVNANITKWKNWNNYANTAGNQNTTIAGIFFDEVEYRDTSKVTYMNTTAKWAKDSLKSTKNPSPYVVYNPGYYELQDYFGPYVDNIVQFERPISAYSSPATINSFPASQRLKTSVIGHTAAGQASTVTAYSRDAKNKIGAIYFAADCCYHDLSLLSAVAAGLN